MDTNGSTNTTSPRQESGKYKIELPPGGVALSDVERELVCQAMERSGGNQTHAAQLLGIERDALRRRLVKYGLLHTPSISGAGRD